MRLKSIYISEYKNLKDFSLVFVGDNFVDIFVGKNGSGKSNFFEATIEIFRHIVEFDRDKATCDFNYRIVFEINGKSTEIGWNTNKLTIDGKERNTIGKTPLPDNILIYYSGHNRTVAKLIGQYEETFRKRIKRADFDETRFFLGIGPEYKELLLAVLLMQPDTCKARKFICHKLGIETVSLEVKVVLERPTYAIGPRFDIELNDETDRYWKSEGITKHFSTGYIAASRPPLEVRYVPRDILKNRIVIFYFSILLKYELNFLTLAHRSCFASSTT